MDREFIFTDNNTIKVGTFYCVASNYSGHAREMNSFIPESPAIFIKPPSAYLPDGGVIKPPAFSKLVHHEVELIVVIGKSCENIGRENTRACIAGFGVGIDVTLRDIQNQAKQDKKPWAISKGFATSAPVSKIVPLDNFNEPHPEFDLRLFVNGELRQNSSTTMMERTYEELIEYLSGIFTLQPGDCIFTGTPEGVGEIKSGDIIRAELSGFVSLTVSI